jgi:hypothetical protein
MRPVTVQKQLAASSVNAISLAQALAGAGNLTLNGASVSGGVATLDTQRRISLLSSGNDSGLTWTISGTNGAGAAISQSIPGGNAVAVATSLDFLTVTKIASSGAVAGTVQVGSNSTGASAWQIPNFHLSPFELAIGLQLLSGAATFGIEVSYDDVRAPLPIYAPPLVTIPSPVGWPGLTGLNGNAQGLINAPVQAWRLLVTAGTGLVEATGTQSGISGP